MATLPRTEHAVARSLAETEDTGDALRGALAAIGESLGWEAGAVWEPAPGEADLLHCTRTWYAPGIDLDLFEAATCTLALARGEGLPGRVWASGEPVWVADVLADDNFPRADAARAAGLRGAVAFPLRTSTGILGAIEFLTVRPQTPDADLLATLGTIGHQLGQAVERRRDAEEMRAQDARLRAMLDAALDCVVTIDHTGAVLGFNPAAERTFGYRAQEVVGREMAELIVPPHLREAHRRGLARYLVGESPVVLDRRIEITGMRADGEEFPVELAITRIDVPGPPTFTGYLRDITDRKQFEADLRASRARIVSAADEARRRLERDLHDGAQQRLVELALDLRMAQARLDGDPGEARALLETALQDLERATSELRELARGIHPAALTEGGLRPALDALLARCSVPVRLVSAPDERCPAAVESTAYFVVAEALTNVVRYAQASRAEVELERHDEYLSVEIRDDGRGGADPQAGSGLLGLADRVAALDGTLSVVSPPGGGTTLRAEIPCAS